MTSDAKTASSTTIPSIVTLPLDHIFSYLDRPDLLKTTLVSKHWHVASSKRLWSKFKFVREKDFERIFHVLSKSNTRRYGNYITFLELVHSDKDFCLNPSHVFLITLLCPNLLNLTITFHHTRTVAPPTNNNRKLPPPLLARQQRPPPPQQLQQLQQPFHPQHQLQRPPPPPQPQQQVPRHTQTLPLAHFAHNCLKLKSIRLVSYSPKTDDSVYEMAKYLTSNSLESITLTNCTTIQSSTLCKLAMTNPQLKSVEIMGTTPISDSSLATIADRCGNSLEYLSIGNACQLSDKSVRYIAAKCKKLLQICIFNNNIEKMTQDTLTAIIQHCTSLRMMSISDSRTLGTEFFEAVVQRVNNEIEKIDRRQAGSETGLQTLCFGAVKRDVISSRFIQDLIDSSASKHDYNGQQHIENNDEVDVSDQLTHLINTTKFMPKSTVIRGNTIWWQRRRVPTHNI